MPKAANPLTDTRDPALQQIAEARHHDPFAVLGRHPHGSGERVLAYLPGARSEQLVESHAPMQRITGTDFFAWQGPAGAEDGKLVMDMRDADIRSLIQWVAEVTGKNLIVHKDVQGKVTVLSAEPVTPQQAYQVFLAALDVHGFGAIESDEMRSLLPTYGLQGLRYILHQLALYEDSAKLTRDDLAHDRQRPFEEVGEVKRAGLVKQLFTSAAELAETETARQK